MSLRRPPVRSTSGGVVLPMPPRPWTQPQLLGFRLAFCYLAQYALACGNDTIWRLLPGLGRRIEPLAARPYDLAAVWLGQHLFHLRGVAAQLHASAFGDRALDWVVTAAMLLLAVLATVAWTVLDRRRRNYDALLGWFRLGLRLTIAVAMMSYGSWKIFPIQMPEPSLAILNEHVGSTSPLALLWTLLGMSPWYERLCGCIEFAAGLMLLRRRTALAGGLLTTIVLSNVLLFNLFYDVPVKLYAGHLLLMAVVVMAPDLPALLRFFFAEPSAPTPTQRRALWSPRLTGRLRWLVPALEAAAFLSVGLIASFGHYRQHAAEQASRDHPPAWTGEWAVQPGSALIPTGDGQPMASLVLEPSGRVDVRAADGVLWGGPIFRPASLANSVLTLAGPGLPGTGYTVTQPQPDQLLLRAADGTSVHLTRVPLPSHYPLLDRGFHWLNEWGYER